MNENWVRMLSVKQWLERVALQMADPDRNCIITGMGTEREKAEAAIAFVAAEMQPYPKCDGDPNFGMRIGKVLWILENSFRTGRNPHVVLREYEGETKSFYRATALGR